MKTLLVPTDFSPAARNAAAYAIRLAEQFRIPEVLLYHAYQAPASADITIPAIQLLDLDQLKKSSEEGMSHFATQFQAPAGVRINTMSEFNVLSSGIEELVDRTHTDLIVMGITGGGKMEEVLIGSNTISVSRNSRVPVLIVPADASFRPVRKVALACDLKKMDDIPTGALFSFLDQSGAALTILHVNEGNHPAQIPDAFTALDPLFGRYSPEYRVIDSPDFTEAVNTYADGHEVDIIITLPKKHGWFERLFAPNHTRKLAFHTHLPLLVVHD